MPRPERSSTASSYARKKIVRARVSDIRLQLMSHVRWKCYFRHLKLRDGLKQATVISITTKTKGNFLSLVPLVRVAFRYRCLVSSLPY